MEIKLKLDLEEIKEKIIEDILENDDNIEYICDMISKYIAAHIINNEKPPFQKIKNKMINIIFKECAYDFYGRDIEYELKKKIPPMFEEDIENFKQELQNKLEKIKELLKKEKIR